MHSAVFHDACFQPAPDQADQARITEQWQAGMAAAERHFEASRIAEAREGQREVQKPEQTREQVPEQPARVASR
jgi:hypothetical protein